MHFNPPAVFNIFFSYPSASLFPFSHSPGFLHYDLVHMSSFLVPSHSALSHTHALPLPPTPQLSYHMFWSMVDILKVIFKVAYCEYCLRGFLQGWKDYIWWERTPLAFGGLETQLFSIWTRQERHTAVIVYVNFMKVNVTVWVCMNMSWLWWVCLYVLCRNVCKHATETMYVTVYINIWVDMSMHECVFASACKCVNECVFV